MTGFAEIAAALRDPDLPRPEGMVDPRGRAATARFDVYRNNVTVGLTEALRDGFPVVAQLVGPEFFAAMAREYLRAHPPRDAVIALWGDGFGDWLAGFPPVAQLPYLPGVARLEYLRRRAYFAADAAPLGAEAAATIAPDRIGGMVLRPHPSAGWMRDPHPVLAIWSRHMAPAAAAEPPGELIVCRPGKTVLPVAAPDGSCATLDALAAGAPLAEALPGGADHAAIFAALFRVSALLPPDIEGEPDATV